MLNTSKNIHERFVASLFAGCFFFLFLLFSFVFRILYFYFYIYFVFASNMFACSFQTKGKNINMQNATAAALFKSIDWY